MTMVGVADCDALVLCGGQGRRLRSVVKDRPKPMVMIDDRPFVDRVLAYCTGQGVRRVILCTGYLGDQFREWYAAHPQSCDVRFSCEPVPLGTAGALKHAASLIRTNPFMVLNGDSLCEVDLQALLSRHTATTGPVTLALTPADSRTDAGCVTVNHAGRLTSFSDTQTDREIRFHNAGIYVCDRAVLDRIPAGRPYSLEQDLLPGLLTEGIYGQVFYQPLYDIGTPERLDAFIRQAGAGVGVGVEERNLRLQ